MLHRVQILTSAIICCLFLGGEAQAANFVAQPIDDLAGDANLVFLGEVQNVSYKNSQSDSQQKLGIPHTFVTYRVIQTLKGTPSSVFTLRFLGGMNENGIVTDVAHFPQFDLGERDIVFVRDNLKSGCPLVQCANGRFRIESNKVFSDDARTIILDSKGKLARGVAQNVVGAFSHTFVHPRTGKSVVISSKGSNIPFPPAESGHLQESQFIGILKRILTQSNSASVEKSAKISDAIPPIPLMPNKSILFNPETPLSPQDQQEILEVQKLNANGGNPVFK
jgi:hypothetical protein